LVVAFANSLGFDESTDEDAGESARAFATIRLEQGPVVKAEIHWYEAAGIGRKEFKIKRILE
jgi:hypothetical protein